MSAKADTHFDEVIHLPGGACCCQGICMEPFGYEYGDLRITPDRDYRFTEEIIWATPKTRFWRYAASIPDAVRTLVKETPHWGLVEICAFHPRGLALLEDCPALAILVMQACLLQRYDERRKMVRDLLDGSWRAMLPKLGLPDRPRTIRILSSLGRSHCKLQVVSRLNKVLCASAFGNDRMLRLISHLPQLTSDTVSLSDYPVEYVSPALLHASIESDPDLESVRMLIGAVRAARYDLGLTGPWPYAGVGFKELERVEHRLRMRLEPWGLGDFPKTQFAERPGEIEFLRGPTALQMEAAKQRNCCANGIYLQECRSGIVCMFRVLRPERATMCLRKDPSTDEWAIDDLRLADNGEVSEETRGYVYAWFLSERANS